MVHVIEYKGTGESPDDPVVITGVNLQMEGWSAEREFLHRKYGDCHGHWKINKLEGMKHGDKNIDKVTIELKDGKAEDVYFAIIE